MTASVCEYPLHVQILFSNQNNFIRNRNILDCIKIQIPIISQADGLTTAHFDTKWIFYEKYFEIIQICYVWCVMWVKTNLKIHYLSCQSKWIILEAKLTGLSTHLLIQKLHRIKKFEVWGRKSELFWQKSKKERTISKKSRSVFRNFVEASRLF